MKLVDIVFVGLVKTSNFLFNELTVAKSEFFKPFLRFLCFIKKSFFYRILLIFILANVKVFLQNFANFYTCKCIFVLGMPHSCAGVFPRKKGGICLLAGLAPSSQTVGSLLRRPLPGLPARKIQQIGVP
jgi:hypothetical protein